MSFAKPDAFGQKDYSRARSIFSFFQNLLSPVSAHQESSRVTTLQIDVRFEYFAQADYREPFPWLLNTGYVFSGPDEIRPHIEVTHTEAGALSQTSNVSLSLASKLAARLGCYVVLGFPERGLAPSAHSQTQASRPEVSVQSSHSRTIQRPADSRVRGEPTWPTPPSTEHGWYNSAMLVDRQGQLLKVFRKHFLFEDDKRWATEGWYPLSSPSVLDFDVDACDMNLFRGACPGLLTARCSILMFRSRF